MKLKLMSKLISSMSFMVASKSSSVSFGKPTMKSELMVMSGRTARRRRILDLYSSTVCGRFIMVRMRSEPLWMGKCRKLTTSGVSR